MKKNIKRIMAVFLVCIMVMGLSVTAFAAGSNHFPYTSSKKLETNASNWQTIAYSDNGFNCKVYIECSNGYVTSNSNIRMLGADGQTVWEETGAQPASGSRVYDCGSNVYTIQIKNQVGKGYAWARYYGEL